jgi:hypothetical protein
MSVPVLSLSKASNSENAGSVIPAQAGAHWPSFPRRRESRMPSNYPSGRAFKSDSLP